MDKTEVIINYQNYQDYYFGKNLSVSNGKIIIDGKEIKNYDAGDITIEIKGNVENLVVGSCKNITVNGHVGCISAVDGNINVQGRVGGKVETKVGNIYCQDVLGNVKTDEGDIICGNVQGYVICVAGDIDCFDVSGNLITETGDISCCDVKGDITINGKLFEWRHRE